MYSRGIQVRCTSTGYAKVVVHGRDYGVHTLGRCNNRLYSRPGPAIPHRKLWTITRERESESRWVIECERVRESEWAHISVIFFWQITRYDAAILYIYPLAISEHSVRLIHSCIKIYDEDFQL